MKGNAFTEKSTAPYRFEVAYTNSCPFCGATENEATGLRGRPSHHCKGSDALIKENERIIQDATNNTSA